MITKDALAKFLFDWFSDNGYTFRMPNESGFEYITIDDQFNLEALADAIIFFQAQASGWVSEQGKGEGN